MSTYGKAIFAVIYAAAVVAYSALSGDANIESDEWVAILIAGTAAVGTYLVPLAPQWPWSKTAVFVLLAFLESLATVILGGLEPGEWLILLMSVAAVLGVGAAPAVSKSNSTDETTGGTVAVGWGSDTPAHSTV